MEKQQLPVLVILGGSVSIGKTTAIRQLSSYTINGLPIRTSEESDPNLWPLSFYQRTYRQQDHTAAAQAFIVAENYKRLSAFLCENSEKPCVMVTERSHIDAIFFTLMYHNGGLLTDEQKRFLINLISIFDEDLPKVNILFLHLILDSSIALQRLKIRARTAELQHTESSLRKIEDAYSAGLKTLTEQQPNRIHVKTINLVAENNPLDVVHKIIDAINDHLSSFSSNDERSDCNDI